MAWETHTRRCIYAHLEHERFSLGVQGDLGTIQSCVHKAAAAFLLPCLSMSFKTNPLGSGATGFDCPA